MGHYHCHIWGYINSMLGFFFGFHIWWIVESKVQINDLAIYSFCFNAFGLITLHCGSLFDPDERLVHNTWCPWIFANSNFIIRSQLWCLATLYSFSAALNFFLLVLALLFYWSINSICKDKMESESILAGSFNALWCYIFQIAEGWL